jgi:membrane protein
MNLKGLWYLISETIAGWRRDNVARLAASLAFYTIFSLAPLLIIVVGLVSVAINQIRAADIGVTLDEAGVVERIALETRSLIGARGEDLVRTIIKEGHGEGSGWIATIVGLVTLLVGSTLVFAELQNALNKVWKVEPPALHGVITVLRARLLSFAMILAIGFLLLVSLLISVALNALGDYLIQLLPSSIYLMRLVSFVISLAFITFLFALIYRYLPDARIAWRDVWVGAIVTALLFTVGKTLIGLYLGNAPFGSAYGAAGSLAVILVWVYFSSQIVLVGAEFTEVYSRRYGSRILSYAEIETAAAQPSEPPSSGGSMANY